MTKSRIVSELAAAAEGQGFVPHKGLVLDFGAGRVKDPSAPSFAACLVCAPTPMKERVGARSTRLSLPVSFTKTGACSLNDLVDVPQVAELHALYNAMDSAARERNQQLTVAEVVRLASSHKPILLIFEDIHWADPATLAHLANLVDVVKGCAAVLLMTTRVEGDPLRGAWRDAGMSPAYRPSMFRLCLPMTRCRSPLR